MEWILTYTCDKDQIGTPNEQCKLKDLRRNIIGDPQKGEKMEAHNIYIFSSTFAVGIQNRLKASHKGEYVQGIGGDLMDRIGRRKKKDPCGQEMVPANRRDHFP